MVPLGLDKSTILTKEMCRNLPHVTICVLGKFKGEMGTDHHMIAVANTTALGLKPWWWVEKLVVVCQSEGRIHGPAFPTPDGKLAMSVDYDSMFRQYLRLVQETTDLIPEDQEVDSQFSTNRTPWKTAATRPKRASFGDEFIDGMNRWRLQDQSNGCFVQRRMNAHYAKAMLMVPTTWLGSHFL